MTIDLATLPQFLTRTDAAELLRLTPKSIDNMVGDGKLARVKLGARRTGITRESMIDHLKRSGLTLPDKPILNADQNGVKQADYASPCDSFGLTLDESLGPIDQEWLTMMCMALDEWLPRHGLKGCHLVASLEHRIIIVRWHKSLGYSIKKVARACMACDRHIDAIKDE